MTRSAQAFAAAKVNLDLRVLGRKADGYHELESLVVFADVGDRVSVTPSYTFKLTVEGRAASELDGPNLLADAAQALMSRIPGLNPGHVTLDKVLPVGAGLGGGSADVAAFLRIMRGLVPDLARDLDLDALALSLGADVPVCLAGKPSWMRGIGERVEPLKGCIPQIPSVLVNPGIPISTPSVFRVLEADAYSGNGSPVHENPVPDTFHELIAWLAQSRNDLEEAALRVAPGVADVRTALERTRDVRLVRMSGSGSTFFGLFETALAATRAQDDIRAQFPSWWVEAVTLGAAPEWSNVLLR